MDAIAEANAESDAQREAHAADLAARLGDAIDRIGMLEVPISVRIRIRALPCPDVSSSMSSYSCLSENFACGTRMLVGRFLL